MDQRHSEPQLIVFHDTIVYPIYFAIYFAVTMFSQISVLLLVILKTPPLFKDFRMFLIHSSTLQILMCLIICFTQVRPVMNPNSTAYLFSGFCKEFDKDVCFFVFDLFQLIFDAAAFSIPVTVYYKYSKLANMTRKEIPKVKVRLILASTYFVSILVALIYALTYRREESLAVEAETKLFYPNTFDFSKYAPITGYQDHVWSKLVNYLNMTSIYIPPIISYTYLRLIQNKLNSLKHAFTDKTAAQARKFDLALTIQTLVPAICVIPVYTIHVVFDGLYIAPFPSHEKVLYILLSLPTAIDAFIVILTITSYRVSFLAFFGTMCCFRKSHTSHIHVRVNGSNVAAIF